MMNKIGYKVCVLTAIVALATPQWAMGAMLPIAKAEVNDVNVVRVKGKVTNSKGEPLPGVNIRVKGTGTGAITDLNGNFTLQIPANNKTLVFSYMGYQSVEQSSGNNMQIVLQEDSHTLGEVVVTTQKRAQSSIEVPTAVSAVSGLSLKKMNLQQFDEVAQFISGVQIQLQSPNNPGYVIRGVTSDDGASYAQPRVSVFQDGVSISRSRASVVELFDLERVEVVKGPQGTLFGRGAEIGGIHVIRNKPVDYLTGELSLGYGTYNQKLANGFINTPIIKGKLANRFAFSYDARDGFIDNLAGGKLNGKSTIALRNSTRLFANEKTTYDLVLDYQYDDYPGTSFKSDKPEYGNPDPNTAANLEQGKNLYIKRHVGGAAFLADHEFNENWKLSSITGFRAFNSNESFDADGTPAYLLWCAEKAKGTQFSQEFRFNYDNKDRFSGFLGASYFYENSSQEVIGRTNMQQLFPAFLYTEYAKRAKPSLESLSSAIPMLGTAMGLSETMITQFQTAYASLMGKWFPESYPLTGADGSVTSMTNTPNFYEDLNAVLGTVGQSLENIIAAGEGGMLGESGKTIAASLKSLQQSSNLPLSGYHEENSTNYGTNQAAEIFADGTLKLVKGLSLTVGLRGTYERQKTGYKSTTVKDPVFGAILYQPTEKGERLEMSDNYLSWVGRAALNYMFKQNNIYVSFSRGRRPGVLYFNNDPTKKVELNPEIIYSYEAGIKGLLFNGKVSYDLCAYYYDWSHFQTSRFDSEEMEEVPDDAGKAHSFGVEAGLRYAPCRYFNIFGNYSYIDGKFNDNNEDGTPSQYAGNRFRLTPKNSFALGVDINIPINRQSEVYFRPTYSCKSKVYFEDSNEPELSQKGYGLANFTAGYRFHPKQIYYEISAFGKNVFDEKYIVDAGNTGRLIGFPTFVGGTRSVFGLQFKVGF